MLAAALVLTALTAWASPSVSKIIYEKGSGVYEIQLLDLALGKTVADWGPYTLQPLNLDLSENRALAMLNQGSFDVTFMVLTPQREKELLPIRIDLSRGIQGYRIFLILKANAGKFQSIISLSQLKAKYRLGFGEQWGDLPVFSSNGFSVVTAARSSELFAMLEADRFDYFPRGINEIWDNVDQHQSDVPDMAVEDHLAFYYPLVECFVVAKTNTKLAARIEEGLRLALDDGSMKKLFLRFHQSFIDKANIPGRLLFRLNNPNLPLDGPRVDTDWWMPADK